MDKTSYAVGLSFGQHLAQSKIKGLDYQSFAKGVEAMCEGKQPEIDLKEAQELLNKFFAKLEEESKAQFAQVSEAGEKFLAENAKRAMYRHPRQQISRQGNDPPAPCNSIQNPRHKQKRHQIPQIP